MLSEGMPEARRVIGMDLSPYMIAVGDHHNQEKKVGRRVSLVYGDVADTRLPTGSASLVSCSYLLHELPDEAVRCAKRAMSSFAGKSIANSAGYFVQWSKG